MAKIEFDLQKALNGTHKICDENENIITDWHYFKESKNRRRLVAVLHDGYCRTFNDDGTRPTNENIYLYVEEKKRYKNVYYEHILSNSFNTIENAINSAKLHNPICIIEHNITTGEYKVVHHYNMKEDAEQ